MVAPEDLVRAPRDGQVIFGQMAGPGGIFLLHTQEQRVEPLFAKDHMAIEPTPGWGSADCPAPEAPLHAHGIDLQTLADGRWRLLASHHASLFALAKSLDQAPDETSLLPYSIVAINPRA
ncbi:MAG: hypothetical protein ABR578_00695 [Chromatocurvus sp.]